MNAPQDNAAVPIAHGLAGWRRLVMWPLCLLVRLWGRTLKFELTPESLHNLTFHDEPVAFIGWHNRLFLVVDTARRYRTRPLHALVSASRDGAWLDAFLASAGLRTVRGSSSNLAREAVAALVTKLREGQDIAITPDGPRGPRYDFKGGALIVARRAGVPAMLFGGRFESAWRLKSWDGFYVPKPFSRVHLICQLVPAAELRAETTTTETLRNRLLAINPD